MPTSAAPTDPSPDLTELTAGCWEALGGPADALDALGLDGPARVLASVFEVTALATASVGVANLAVAELHAARTERPVPRVTLDTAAAAAAFRAESLLEADGWDLPEVWDPLAGDYPTLDGWVRLHTNYAHHRDAALRALQVPPDRDGIAAALVGLPAEEVESLVVADGGCAAAMRTMAAWRDHPQGAAVASEPLIALDRSPGPAPVLAAGPQDRPLSGVRVLDLTRVIAGPVATRFLAAHGADVLRIDPPGFAEVPLLVIETTAGKRRTAFDLRRPAGREALLGLVAEAQVLVSGYRNGALEALGLGDEALTDRNPGLVHVRLDAYGWTGPWAGRRGFDSLVQMSAGIADRGRRARGVDRPVPLPAQALDHATGFLAAAAAARALTEGLRGSPVRAARLSLARTAHTLLALGDGGDIDGVTFDAAAAAAHLEPARTAWGPVRRVRIPGTIEGHPTSLVPDAGPIGTDPPGWAA